MTSQTTQDMTRQEKEALLLGATRLTVRVIDEHSKKVVQRIPVMTLPTRKAGTRFGDVVLFTDQRDGGFHLMSTGLVKDIQEEQQNYYGDWVLVQTIDPQAL